MNELYETQYELLPLRRPTRSDASMRRELDDKEKSIVSDMVNIAEKVLQNYSGKGELLSRQNVNR